MSREAYPKYKPSGVEWFRELPEHWRVRKLKHVASVQFSSVDKHTIEGEEPVRLCNYVDVYYNDFIKEGLEFMSATATRSEIARFQLRHGDVLVTKDSESWDDIAVPAYVAEELDGVLCGYHLAHIRPDLRKLIGEYLFRAFRSCGINDQFRVAANGITRFGLGKYWLDNGLFPVPPLEEQRTIAAFLDRETARIDALIEKKQRQMELLQEKRSALISHAVTKGLDPNVKMKDSGIEWFGEMPAHWGLKRLKFVSSICTGDKDTVDNVEGGQYPFFVRSQTVERINSFSFDGEAVLTAGDGVGVAKVFHYIKGKFDFHQRVYKFSGFRHISGRFFFYYIRELFREEVIKLSAKSTVDSLRLPMIQDFVFCVPTLDEQTEIVQHLDQEGSLTRKAETQISQSILLLKEYRSALISAAVTGKIDVRKEVT